MEYYSAIKKNEIMPFAATCVSGSVVSDSATPQIVARQASLSMGFSRQEYWSGLLSLLQGIFPIQALNQQLLGASPALAVRFFTTSTTWEVLFWETDISNNESKAG